MNNSINSRQHLADKIKNGAILLHSGSVVYRNNDTWYPFRQDSNFYYLTEWPEPDAHAVILIKDSNINGEIPLFIVFRALGIVSDKEILQYIVKDIDNDVGKEMMEFIRPTIVESNMINSKNFALEFLKNKTYCQEITCIFIKF